VQCWWAYHQRSQILRNRRRFQHELWWAHGLGCQTLQSRRRQEPPGWWWMHREGYRSRQTRQTHPQRHCRPKLLSECLCQCLSSRNRTTSTYAFLGSPIFFKPKVRRIQPLVVVEVGLIGKCDRLNLHALKLLQVDGLIGRSHIAAANRNGAAERPWFGDALHLGDALCRRNVLHLVAAVWSWCWVRVDVLRSRSFLCLVDLKV